MRVTGVRVELEITDVNASRFAQVKEKEKFNSDNELITFLFEIYDKYRQVELGSATLDQSSTVGSSSNIPEYRDSSATLDSDGSRSALRERRFSLSSLTTLPSSAPLVFSAEPDDSSSTNETEAIASEAESICVRTNHISDLVIPAVENVFPSDIFDADGDTDYHRMAPISERPPSSIMVEDENEDVNCPEMQPADPNEVLLTSENHYEDRTLSPDISQFSSELGAVDDPEWTPVEEIEPQNQLDFMERAKIVKFGISLDSFHYLIGNEKIKVHKDLDAQMKTMKVPIVTLDKLPIQLTNTNPQSPSNRKMHTLQWSRVECSVCHSQVSLTFIDRHYKTKHNKKPDDNILHQLKLIEKLRRMGISIMDKTISCKCCPEKFVNKGSLQQHMSAVHRDKKYFGETSSKSKKKRPSSNRMGAKGRIRSSANDTKGRRLLSVRQPKNRSDSSTNRLLSGRKTETRRNPSSLAKVRSSSATGRARAVSPNRLRTFTSDEAETPRRRLDFGDGSSSNVVLKTERASRRMFMCNTRL